MNKNLNSFVGWRIRQLRMDEGLSEGELAQRLGISRRQLEDYENGNQRIDSGCLLAIAETLKVPITQLFADIRLEEVSRD